MSHMVTSATQLTILTYWKFKLCHKLKHCAKELAFEESHPAAVTHAECSGIVWYSFCVIVILCRCVCVAAVVRASSAGAYDDHKSELEIVRETHATLNDMPIPQGSWQEQYDKRNAKWNRLLGISVVCFSITTYLVCPFGFCNSWCVTITYDVWAQNFLLRSRHRVMKWSAACDAT